VTAINYVAKHEVIFSTLVKIKYFISATVGCYVCLGIKNSRVHYFRLQAILSVFASLQLQQVPCLFLFLSVASDNLSFETRSGNEVKTGAGTSLQCGTLTNSVSG